MYSVDIVYMVGHGVVERGSSGTRLAHRIKDDLEVVRNKACLLEG